MNALGRHVLIEFHDCDAVKLNDFDLVRQAMLDATKACGATLIGELFHRFNPHGVSGAIVIAESHLSIHTWPEHHYAAVDLFTCGKTIQPWRAFDFLKESLGSTRTEVKEIERGLFPHPVSHKIDFD